jgi:hypothetical protein
MASTRGKRLRAARAKRFRSARAAAIAFGVPISTYGAHERAESRGGRDYGPEEARQYARRLGVTPEWLLTGYHAQPGEHADTPAEQSVTKLRVVGYVGASATIHLYEVKPEHVEEIEARLPVHESTVALEIRDNSIMGLLPKNWLLLYDDDKRRPTPDLIGELCVVAHKDGRVVLQSLRPGDASIRWAAAVKAIIRR